MFVFRKVIIFVNFVKWCDISLGSICGDKIDYMDFLLWFQKYMHAADIDELPEALAGGIVLLFELLLESNKCTRLHVLKRHFLLPVGLELVYLTTRF